MAKHPDIVIESLHAKPNRGDGRWVNELSLVLAIDVAVSAVQCWLLRAGVSVSWVARSIVAVAVVAAVVTVWPKAATHGYMVQPVLQECNPELRGETGDLVLHVRATGDMSLNYESIQLRSFGARRHDIYEVRRTQKFLDEPLPGPSISKQLRDIQFDIQRFKVLFLDFDTEIPFQTAVDVMSIVTKSVPNVRLVLITPAILRAEMGVGSAGRLS